MKQKLLTLALLAPLFYTACNSTPSKPTTSIIETKEIKKETEVVPQVLPTTITKANSFTETTVSYATDKTAVKEQGLMHIESFMETLKPTLMGLMKSDSTYKTAMGGCTSMAQGMTNDYNAISPDTKIRRTALKYRNEKNKPDATDTVVMERFLASKNLKEPLVVEMPNHYRVYKALDMKQPCLACHGTNISEDLGKMLEKSYPKDLATHFKLGEFRGTIVAEVKK
ncbi:MAG: Cytochrome c family protein [uncultured Sulfurovum sp.]|uniref:Cytochrome c family protein n=1 Tax=uncultured Sulfurovum sp. TaxID=269237 RepID=A0A6S6T568_9BACT|nr:MAG: Cytochrome c family protein [uncultured Sulfurovum sp.]